MPIKKIFATLYLSLSLLALYLSLFCGCVHLTGQPGKYDSLIHPSHYILLRSDQSCVISENRDIPCNYQIDGDVITFSPPPGTILGSIVTAEISGRTIKTKDGEVYKRDAWF